jgi:hypothetical protein
MRYWTAVSIMLVLSICTTGCKPPKITFSITITPQGKASATNQKTFADISTSDAINNSQQMANSLIDTDPTLSYDSTTAPQALITATTDNGQVFTQSFSVTPSDASGFSPAAAGTVTYAFAPQNSAAVSDFLRAAANHANATLTVDVQTRATFLGPTDGSDHTLYGRQYTSSDGVTNLGSATYTSPQSCGDGGPLLSDHTILCP